MGRLADVLSPCCLDTYIAIGARTEVFVLSSAPLRKRGGAHVALADVSHGGTAFGDDGGVLERGFRRS